MQAINKLGLKTKMLLPFALTGLAIVLLGFLNVSTVRNLVGDVDEVSTAFLPAISEILNADRDLHQAYIAQDALIVASREGDPVDPHFETFSENADQALDRMEAASEHMDGTGINDSLSGFHDAFSSWRNSAEAVNEMAANGNPEQARERMKSETIPRFDELRSFYNEAGEFTDEEAVTTASNAADEGRASITTTVTTTLIVLAISIGIFLFATRLITGAINQLRRRLDDIAQGEGDLTRRVESESNDELGRLADSFNAVLGNLQSMIGEIKELATNLDSGADELRQTAKDNSDGIYHQTESINQVATAINEVQSAIEEVSSNANQAAEVTRSTHESASSGSQIIHDASSEVKRLADQIQEAVNVIQKLSEDSGNISTVLDVIRGIADQTNLLALNAAIEAARAGEHGRGFSVVADEVRTLAQRTQKSTTEINDMIENLQSGVSNIVSVMETGRQQATQSVESSNRAEEELNTILEGMNRITDINASVASATEEQTQAVEEINQNVTRINDLAQDSDERSRNLNDVSERLADYARSLSNQVAQFRT
ncbi:chemotaxis protein [Halovibrio salipaludis]|uniref:Chemotaxis protein n=1 Tax=Halovibrio salipaludis TaxID=2032626 RepID=A0A2A2FB62_9GAMM|nr:methyl-accepting chemotaxis protein [Halovibrio salipaludis]PAU81835.1 chemotaxis protein [Halovibrio salipaludis]